MIIKNFVLTGGPCAGKTSALNAVRSIYQERGYTVLTMSETASDLINGGIAPWTCGTNCDFQSIILKLQMEREAAVRYAATTMAAETILIFYDRGAMDNRAYMTADEFSRALTFADVEEQELFDRYDAVFHMTTAAKSDDDTYSLRNNRARYETKEQAIVVDDNAFAAWKNHPHHYVIKNAPTIEAKIAELVTKIDEML